MDDTQFKIFVAIVSAGLTAIGGVLRWGALRIVKALDDNTAVHSETARANVEGAKATAVLSTKIDTVVTILHHLFMEPMSLESESKLKAKVAALRKDREG